MGQAKKWQQEQNDKYQSALGLAINGGAIDECDIHEGCYFSGSQEHGRAYALATTRFKRGELPEYGSLQEMRDLMKEAIDDNSGLDECPLCAKNRDDD